MPIAAVPGYLESDLSSASPALRFGMYLPIWTERADQKREVRERAEKKGHEGQALKQRLVSDGMDAVIKDLVQRERLPGLWDKNEQEGRTAWKEIVDLTSDDQIRMKALVGRQAALFQTMTGGTGLELVAQSTAPFTTGLGNEHPLENGFTFLNPYGLPCLPGSGVKGVIRRAAEELAHRDFFENDSGWTLPAIWHLFGFEAWPASKGREKDAVWKDWVGGFSASREEIDAYLDAVLDENTEARRKPKRRILEAPCPMRALLQEQHLHVRGALEFWDVIPQINGKKLAVEIMTPHHSHYYQNKTHAGSTSPHDSGNPNPISFLTVPPGSDFVFHVRCDHRRLSRCAPELATDGCWHTLLKAAFEHAFEWLGFGAKTAVGYGALKRDLAGEERSRREREKRERAERERVAQEQAEKEAEAREAERLATLSPIEREIDTAIRDRQDKNMSEIRAITQAIQGGRWEGDAKIEAAKWLESKMRNEKRWKETSTKKRPDKDKDYQSTLLVKGWLEGK